MSMQFKSIIYDAHIKPILCIQYNPFRREIITGSEDGTIKIWESESGKLVNTLVGHEGWVTDVLYCKELRTLFSCSLDGKLIVWSPNGKPAQTMDTDEPMYCLSFNARRQQILIGHHSKIRVFQLIPEDSRFNLEMLEPKSACTSEHTDIISCLSGFDGRFYSAGYDRRIVIYDSPHIGEMTLRKIHVVHNAHDAAISTMMFGKDADNQWLMTGSFDRVVKLWSLDGNLLQKFDGFNNTISALAYAPPTQTLWVSANSGSPLIFDPRSGTNLTDFVSKELELPSSHSNNANASANQQSSAQSSQQRDAQQGSHFGSYGLIKRLLYIPEINEMYGVTNRRNIVIWRYNPCAAITTLTGHADMVECLTVTSQEPLFIFSGGGDGFLRKWERLQLNTFMYAQEALHPNSAEEKLAQEQTPTGRDSTSSSSKSSADINDPTERRKRQFLFHKNMAEKIEKWKRTLSNDDSHIKHASKHVQALSRQTVEAFIRKQRQMEAKSKIMDTNLSGARAEARNPLLKKKKPGQEESDEEEVEDSPATEKGGILKVVYYDHLDYVICGHESKKISVWGYDENAFKFVPSGITDDSNNGDGVDDNNVTSRLSGLVCKYNLNGHEDAVTALASFKYKGRHILISSGWDRRLIVWDLKAGQMRGVYSNSSSPFGRDELIADDVIYDMEYAAERNEFGYASADGCAYIRKFSTNVSEMKLQAVLQGHESDVTQIKWCRKSKTWITGSEDRTIRVWPAEGIPCLRVFSNEGPVTALSVDMLNGCIVTGSSDYLMRVFDPERKDELVQKNYGHKDQIRAIIHIPVRHQYVSVSWDGTIKIWNAYFKKGQRRMAVVTTENIETTLDSTDQINNEQEANAYNEAKAREAELGEELEHMRRQAKKAAALSVDKNSNALGEQMEQLRLENELKTTINDLESALAGTDKLYDKNAAVKNSNARPFAYPPVSLKRSPSPPLATQSEKK